MGLIRSSQSPFASPCMLINKPDGGHRLVINYAKLNAQCYCQAFSIPRIDELIDRVGQAKFLTKLDITKTYWNVKLDEDSIKYSTFVTGEQHLEFLTLPFSLSGACSTFLRLVSNCLDNCREYTAGYFDDILVHIDDWNSHLSHLNNVFLTILEVGFTLNLKKGQFERGMVDFVGFQVGMGRIELCQRKVEAILNFLRPQSINQYLIYNALVYNKSLSVNPLTAISRGSG